MPELPEVETIRRQLKKTIIGKKILGVEILSTPLESRQQPIGTIRLKGGSRLPALVKQDQTHKRWILTGSKKQFLGNPKEIIGAKIKNLDRRAKYLIINLDNNKSLLIHLKLTGQLVWTSQTTKKATFERDIPFAGGAELPGRTTRIIIRFNEGTLFFNDLRKFGWIKIVRNTKLDKNFEKLGPEPFSKNFNENYLKNVFSKTARPIKIILLDQEKIAGIGNIYANEALFKAKINPSRPAKSLTSKEINALKRAIIDVLQKGLKYGGSSAADEAYIRPDALPGYYQQHFLVYQKNGQKCPRCGKIIKRISLGGRGTFFCPACQR